MKSERPLSSLDNKQLLLATKLGEYFKHPEMTMALAQNVFLERILPFVRMPDVLVDEERLVDEWTTTRGAATRRSKEYGQELEARFRGLPFEAIHCRIILGLAAYRKIDAAVVGSERFYACPLFMGESYMLCKSTAGLSIKAGLVRTANYWPNPETDASSEKLLSDRELVYEIERMLLPFVPPAGENNEKQLWLDLYKMWRAVEPLRKFEQTNKLPLFPEKVYWEAPTIPAGYQWRIQPETMAKLGMNIEDLITAGISPYISTVFAEFCAARQHLLAEIAEDPLTLAEQHLDSLIAA